MSFSIYGIYILALLSFLLFIIFGIYSIIENEQKATTKAFIISILIPLILISTTTIHYPFGEIIRCIILIVSFCGICVLMAPIYPEKLKLKNQSPKDKIDEKNVMFARSELIKGTENYNKYYKMFPEHKVPDDKFRKFPGLLSEKSSKYETFTFTAAIANFQTVEHFKHQVSAPVENPKKEIDSLQMSRFIKSWMKKIGVVDIGITELQPYHLYSYRGRNYNFSEKVKNNHKYAIALIVEMSEEMLKDAPNGSTVMESSYQYLRAGNYAMQLAWFIRNNGYEARAHIDGNYEVVCPLVAKDAGLGDIGRMGLLMTPKLGSRVRIAVVTTNMTLNIDKAKNFSWMTTFCKFCKKCADNCPSNAISKKSPEKINGIKRWQISQEKCYTYWTKIGTDCAKCITVCPFSHPNNLLHNFVRLFISKSYLFARFSLIMDDFFYGRKPKATKPKWLKPFIN